MKIQRRSIMKAISDTYLEERLNEWADWIVRYNAYGVGYPHKTIEARLREEGGILISGTGQFHPPTNPRAEEIERCLTVLNEQIPKLANAVRAYYLEPGLIKHRAKKAGCSYSQFRVLVDMAKVWLKGRLSAIYESHYTEKKNSIENKVKY